MSLENVEYLRGLYAAFNRGEREPLFEALDPEVSWRGAQDSEPHRGHEGVRRSLSNWNESLEGASFEPKEFLDVGPSILCVVLSRGRGRSSGALLAETFFAVFTFSDGKITRFEEFSTRREALEAVGLSA
jgi:ketosteroid isomerase-like protein